METSCCGGGCDPTNLQLLELRLKLLNDAVRLLTLRVEIGSTLCKRLTHPLCVALGRLLDVYHFRHQ